MLKEGDGYFENGGNKSEADLAALEIGMRLGFAASTWHTVKSLGADIDILKNC